MASINKITELYSQYMGFTPSSKDINKFSMTSSADVEDILRNTKTDVQSGAAQKAHTSIEELSSALGVSTTDLPYQSNYMTSLNKGRTALEEQYGLPEAEGRMRDAEDFYRQIAEKGPMFEMTMRGGLAKASPTFLGATRKDLEGYFKDIPNPFVRDKMVGNYLQAADRSMVSTLNALNGLYKTSLISAQTGVEASQSHYQRIADKTKDLYSELQWVNRNRYQEQEDIRKEQRGLETWKQKETYRAGLEKDEEGRIWTDFELRTSITALQTQGASRDEILQEINSDPTILNKDKAIQIVDKIMPLPEKEKPKEKPKTPGEEYKESSEYWAGIREHYPEAQRETFGKIKGALGRTAGEVGGFFKGIFGF